MQAFCCSCSQRKSKLLDRRQSGYITRFKVYAWLRLCIAPLVVCYSVRLLLNHTDSRLFLSEKTFLKFQPRWYANKEAPIETKSNCNQLIVTLSVNYNQSVIFSLPKACDLASFLLIRFISSIHASIVFWKLIALYSGLSCEQLWWTNRGRKARLRPHILDTNWKQNNDEV